MDLFGWEMGVPESRTDEHDKRLDSLTSRVEAHNQRMTQQQESKIPDSQQVMTYLRDELRETYLRICRSGKSIPWVEKTIPLQDVFIEPTLKRSTERSLSQSQGDERSVGLADILQPLEPGTPPPRRVLVEGASGMGKSTMCQRLLSGWAEGVQASSPELDVASSARADAPSHAPTRPHTGTRSTTLTMSHSHLTPVTSRPSDSFGGACPQHSRVQERVGSSPIGGFTIVLFLMVRNLVVGDLTENLLFLLLGESWRPRQEELRACLEENCQQVLIFLDGFNDAVRPHKELLTTILGEQEMKGCTVIVTSTPGFCSSRFDATFQLQGFDHQKRARYIDRFVEIVKAAPDHPSTKILVQHLESPGIMGDLCQTPLFLMLFCVLGSQEGSTLPNTCTQLYEQFVNFLHRQAVQRHGFQPEYMSSLQQALQRIAFALLKDNTTDISLATIEQHSVTQPSTLNPSTVNPPAARADVTLHALCHVGFLIQNYKLQGLDHVMSGSFIHQSFIDYFAAKNFITMSNEHRETFIVDHISHRTMFHDMFVYVAGCCGKELLVELFDGWRRAVAALRAPHFDSSDLVSEMWDMGQLTQDNHALFHDAPFSWSAESTDVCTASLALLSHVKAICLTRSCTVSCVRSVKTLCKVLGGLQSAPALHLLYLGLYGGGPVGAGDMVDVVKQSGLTHGIVHCILLEASLYGVPVWTASECTSLATLPGFMWLRRIGLHVAEWSPLEALSKGFTDTHALRQLRVVCDRPVKRCVQHSQHSLTEFRRNVRFLSNIQQIEIYDWSGGLSVEAECDLRDWGVGRGVKMRVGVHRY